MLRRTSRLRRKCIGVFGAPCRGWKWSSENESWPWSDCTWQSPVSALAVGSSADTSASAWVALLPVCAIVIVALAINLFGFNVRLADKSAPFLDLGMHK